MYMRFTPDEVEAIVQAHVVEKMGIPVESVERVYFADDSGHVVDGSAIEVEIATTDKGVPAGPYRTSSK